MEIKVYSDGSATTADKAGGWGAVIIIDGKLHKELAGRLETATNNDAELIASIQGLDYTLNYLSTFQGSFPLETEVTLISDSQIVLNWANGTYRFKQLEKMFLYEQLRRLVRKLEAKTQWVKGHSGDQWNERCDRLANDARKNILKKDLDKSDLKRDTRIGSKKTGVVCLWYSGQLKVIDFETGVIENYDREVHGKRGSVIEIREDKVR